MNINDLLISATESGELLSICYSGGSRPGAARDLIIVSVSLDSFQAYEAGSFHTKSYKFEKVIWVADSVGNRIEGPAASGVAPEKIPEFQTLREYESLVRERIGTDAWALECDENHLSAFGFFKNGKKRKTPSVKVSYNDPRRFEPIWDYETGDIITIEREPTGNERPWRLDSKRFSQGKSKKHFRPIVEEFIVECLALDNG